MIELTIRDQPSTSTNRTSLKGSETTVGKRVGKDNARGKTTYPAVLGVEASHQRAQTLIDEACQAIEQFSKLGSPLRELAKYVLQRNK